MPIAFAPCYASEDCGFGWNASSSRDMTMPNASTIAFIAFAVLPSLLTAQGSAGGTLSERAEYILFRGTSGADAPIDVLLILRGQPGWMNRDAGRNSASRTTSAIAAGDVSGRAPIRYGFDIGGVKFECSYQAYGRVLRMWGEEHRLDSTNVLLIDRIDSVGGPPIIVRKLTLTLPAAHNDRLAGALLGVPALQEFVR